jgi:hypothetical protein
MTTLTCVYCLSFGFDAQDLQIDLWCCNERSVLFICCAYRELGFSILIARICSLNLSLNLRPVCSMYLIGILHISFGTRILS